MSIEEPLIKLQDALSSISAFSPLTSESMDLITDEQVQDIDQFILRYTKLQDTMGSRLFTSILNYLYEPVPSEKNAAQLNMAFASIVDLYNMLDAIRIWFRNAYPMLELGKELPKMPADL
jgi:hypothetical protein